MKRKRLKKDQVYEQETRQELTLSRLLVARDSSEKITGGKVQANLALLLLIVAVELGGGL